MAGSEMEGIFYTTRGEQQDQLQGLELWKACSRLLLNLSPPSTEA